jgi:hypothetical protein
MTSQRRTRRGVVRAAIAAALTLATTAAIGPTPAAAAAPSAVVTWNGYAQISIWDVSMQSPHVQSRSFAMVQGAVYDAVNAIAGKPYQPYLVAPSATGTESVEAAVAASAHQVLLSLFPGQSASLQARYDAYLATIPNGPKKQAGIAIGNQTAAAMIASRQNDGAFGPQTFAVGTQPGQWRPVPPSNANDGGWVGFMKPFLIPSQSMFRTSGPNPLTSAAYAKDFNEVKQIGRVDSTTRTADQSDSAVWWHDRRLTEWEIKRQIATNKSLNNLQAARMFAMANLAEADALVACYNEKYAWNDWRPYTAIRLADTDGNPATVADPNWTPWLNTPPFPDFTSGHTCYTAATMGTLAYFFKTDNMSFSAFSPASNSTRSFTKFSQALTEVINARVWGGIHTRHADVQGAKIGAQVTAYMIAHHFRPR